MPALGLGAVVSRQAPQYRHPFTYPTGTWHVPLTSTTPFVLKRPTNTGQTLTSITRVDQQDFVSGNAIVNSLEYVSGTTYDGDGGVGYAFQADDGHPAGGSATTADLTNYHMLIRFRYTADSTATLSLFIWYRMGASWTSPIRKMTIATHGLMASDGVYSFSVCPSGPGWTAASAGDQALTSVAVVAITMAKSAGTQPVIEILDWALVPKPTRPGILVLHCDDVDTDVELCDWLDANIPGAKATLYVRDTDAAGILEYRRVNNNGHLVCHYGETFGTPTGIDAQISAQATMRAWLIDNGFEKGSRFLVMGGTAPWGEDYERAWPLNWDSITFMDTSTNAQVHSPYHHNYMSRARHGGAGVGNDWATTGPAEDGTYDDEMTALLTGAIADHGRMGVLVHDLGAPGNAQWDIFTSWLTTNVAPRVADGTLQVLNARDAYLSGF